MIQEKEINIDNIVDNHYDNTPMIDTNEDSDDVYRQDIPEHLRGLSEVKLNGLKSLFRTRF
jgi:hypothetical protein